MADTLRATCPVCGDVEFQITPGSVLLVVYASGPESYYEFTCSQCERRVRKPASAEVIALLTSGKDVQITYFKVSAELRDRRRTDGYQLSVLDLQRFTASLARLDQHPIEVLERETPDNW